MKTQKVEIMTEIRGAIAGTQKSFLFLFPCNQIFILVMEITKMHTYTILEIKKKRVTMNLATRRKVKKLAPMAIVCQFH